MGSSRSFAGTLEPTTLVAGEALVLQGARPPLLTKCRKRIAVRRIPSVAEPLLMALQLQHVMELFESQGNRRRGWFMGAATPTSSRYVAALDSGVVPPASTAHQSGDKTVDRHSMRTSLATGSRPRRRCSSLPVALLPFAIACSASSDPLAQPTLLTIEGPPSVLRGNPVTLRALPLGVGDAVEWRLDQQPAGSATELSARGDTATFVADRRGTYVVRARKTSASGTAEATATIESKNNRAVAITVMPNRVVAAGEVQLDGRDSYDADGDPLTYHWSLLRSPSSSAVVADADQPLARLAVDLPGLYQLQLVVNDGLEDSLPELVNVAFDGYNTRPVAEAGPDQRVRQGELTTLDGSLSHDDDGDALTYFWTLSTPAGSQAFLSEPTAARSSFRPDVVGTYRAVLLVSDPWESSAPDEAIVETVVNPLAPLDQLNASDIYILGTLVPGSCARGALSHWASPNTYATGFPCEARTASAMIRPTGRLIYRHQDLLSEFRCDACPGDDPYPLSPEVNDPAISTTPCIAGGPRRLWDHLVSPENDLWVQCSSASPWAKAGTTLQFDLPVHLKAVGAGGFGIAFNGDVVVVANLATGATSSVADAIASDVTAIRSHEDGFWLAVGRNGLQSRLVEVGRAGDSVVVGEYAPVPLDYAVDRTSGALDAEANLYQIAASPIGNADVVLRRDPNGSFDVVYDEATSPAVRLHASKLVTGP